MGIYITLPICLSLYFSNPETQRYWADYYQFIKYPENPNTNVREKIQELAKEKQRQAEQHKVYQQQLRDLADAAKRSHNFENELSANETKSSWWERWITGSKKDS